MESVKTIRAVERAFEVLGALHGLPEGATLAELQRHTGLSKPTLLRLVKTLIGVRAVRRGMVDQRYRLSTQLDVIASGRQLVDQLSDLAAPILDELCQELEWPSDLLMHAGDDDYLTVLESSLRRSRFYVRRRSGRLRVNLMGSASGAAFMSALNPRRQQRLVDVARLGSDVHNLKIIAAGSWREGVAEARHKGYAVRHSFYRGGGYNAEARDDRLWSLAVPLICGGFVLGALNINWNRKALDEAAMARRCVARLQEASAAIASAAEAYGIPDASSSLSVAVAP
ncbi:MAG: helix-turn-helix domain-containing protein [Pigmentiphaga sp.]|nr:helix-turn-helix domain-containing protein [Pigmentiphaga sp.]